MENTIPIVLLALLALLLAGFALVGALHTFRTAPPLGRVRVRGGAAPSTALPVDDPRFPEILELLARGRLRGGHRVELCVNGEGTFERLWADLRAARRSITFHVYFARPGRVAEELAAILRERARAGVRVYVVFDDVGSRLPREYAERLREAGVRVAELRSIKPWLMDRANYRSHQRVIVADGEIGYTGGFGLADEWLGGGKRPEEWRDTNARFTGPAVGQLQAAFAVTWAEATGELLGGEDLFPPAPPDSGGERAAFLHTQPGPGSTAAERLVALAVGGAQRQLLLTSAYFAPDDALVGWLTAAARRGVDVRVLTANWRNDLPITRWGGRARYEELLEAGARIWEYQPSTLHAKTFVVDGLLSCVGTLNFDRRSLALNDESALVAQDRGLAERLSALFEQDLALSAEIRLEEFRRRPWTERVKERCASLFARFI